MQSGNKRKILKNPFKRNSSLITHEGALNLSHQVIGDGAIRGDADSLTLLESDKFQDTELEVNPCNPKKWFLTSSQLTQRNWTPFDCNNAFTSKNNVTALIDGKSYMDELHGCLLEMNAHDYINIVGWNITKDVKLLGENTKTEFIDLLTICVVKGVTIRVLINDFYWPTKLIPASMGPFKQNDEFIQALRKVPEKTHTIGTVTVEAFLDNRYIIPKSKDFVRGESPIGSHHQKAILLTVKKECTAFVGGIDVGDDRFDSSEHLPPKLNAARKKVNMAGWHDIQLKVQGPATQQIWANFVERWNDLTAPNSKEPNKFTTPVPPQEMPPWSKHGTQHVQVLRTFACPQEHPNFPFLKNGEQTVRDGLIKAIRRAQCYIYIEDQYFWASELLDEIANTDPMVQIILVLSRDMDVPGKNDWQQHIRADAFAKINRNGERCHAYHLQHALQHTRKDSVIYVHSKLMIIDDRYVSVGSANMAYRSTTTDTELTLAVLDAKTTTEGTMYRVKQERCVFARDLRMKLWAEHLDVPEEDLDDPIVALEKCWPPYYLVPKKPLRRHHVVCHHPEVEPSRTYEHLKSDIIFNPKTS